MGNFTFCFSGTDIPDATQPEAKYPFLSRTLIFRDYPQGVFPIVTILKLIS